MDPIRSMTEQRESSKKTRATEQTGKPVTEMRVLVWSEEEKKRFV